MIEIDPAFLSELIKKHEEAFASTCSLRESPEFKLKKKDGDFNIYVKKDPINKFDQIMSWVSMPFTEEEILSQVRCLDLIDEHTPDKDRNGIAIRRILWEDKEDKEHENLIVYICMETPVRIVSKRDFLIFRRLYRDNGRAYFMHISFDNEKIMPQVEGNVRGQIYFQMYIVEDDPDIQGNKKLWFLAQANPMGNIPAWVYNAIVVGQAQNPQIIKNTLEALKSKQQQQPANEKAND